MGQKVNPNIYQLGKTKNWSSKFIEKNKNEIANYSLKDLEINKFIFKFFSNYGLYINTCKTAYSENNIFIFVSYFINNKLVEQQQKRSVKKRKLKKRFLKTKFLTKKIAFKKSNFLFKHFIKTFVVKKKITQKLKSYFNKTSLKKRITTRLKVKQTKKKHFKFFNSQLKNTFLNKIFDNLKLFFIERKKIYLTFYQLNNSKENFFFIKKDIKFLNKYLSTTRPFNNTNYLKEGLHVILLVLKHKNTSNLLATYLAKELQNHKKQHFFLTFIEKTLEAYNKKEFCIPKNIKIKIKGRFNGVPRSKTRTLIIGNPISIISAKTKVFYSQETSYSENGTFGVKVWISENVVIKKVLNVARPKKA